MEFIGNLFEGESEPKGGKIYVRKSTSLDRAINEISYFQTDIETSIQLPIGYQIPSHLDKTFKIKP